MKLIVGRDQDEGVDHLPAVQALYDLVVSIAGGSGFFDAEEYAAVKALAAACGFREVELLRPQEPFGTLRLR